LHTIIKLFFFQLFCAIINPISYIHNKRKGVIHEKNIWKFVCGDDCHGGV